MHLEKLLEQFFLDRECSENYRSSLKRTVRRAVAYELLSVCQLNSESINKFLCSLTDFAQETRANYRRELCTLLRYAHEIGLTDALPTRVRKIRVARPPARAWSMDDLTRMHEVALTDESRIGGKSSARVCDILPAWILVGYETGLRFGDVLALTKQSVRRDTLFVVESKTGKTATFALSESALGAVSDLDNLSPDDTLFLWALTRRRAFLLWRKFLDAHGFEGTPRWLRRSAATYIERENAGEATRFLRHSAPHLARIHYVDPSLLAPPTAPPALRVRAG